MSNYKMNPRHIYLLESETNFLAYQGRKTKLLGYIRHDDAVNVSKFITNRNINIKKCQNETYKIFRSNSYVRKPRVQIVKCEPDALLIDCMVNNIQIDMVDQIHMKNMHQLEMHSNYTFGEFKLEMDIYKKKLDALYNDEEFDIIDAFEDMNINGDFDNDD